jgi:hypothetical protein
MPIHDWSRVPHGTFHDVHQSWMVALRNTLNRGVLPRGYFAAVEQRAPTREADLLALRSPSGPETNGSHATPEEPRSAVAIAERRPAVRLALKADVEHYADRADRIAIRYAGDGEPVGFVEIVSPGNKSSRQRTQEFVGKLRDLTDSGAHLLVVDLHRPGPFDPGGLAFEFWGYDAPSLKADEPLILFACRSGRERELYAEPTAVGRTLIDMPLFLTEQRYVNVPLEATYQESISGMPEPWREKLEGTG